MDYIIDCPAVFSPALTLDCGQSFRWKQEGSNFSGVAYGKKLILEQNENKLIFHGCTEEDFNSVWKNYFDLETDYEKILSQYDDEYLKAAVAEYSGIRILRQEPWEALCSFIISQNNNIPRIKGIIERLCAAFGEGEKGFESFPSPERLASLSVEDLAPLRSGFRAKYIIDAARKVADGEVDFDKIRKADLQEGRDELKKIKGVGDKVAECTLLYGFYKIDAFPVDVWVKRIMAELYPDGLPACTEGSRGIAQQYLFHWRRMKDNK